MDKILHHYFEFFPDVITEGHCVMVDVPKYKKLMEYIAKIPNECLYEEVGENYGRETNPHVTVLYELSPVTESKVKSVLSKVPNKIVAELGKVSKFENEKFDVLKIEVKSSHLTMIHEMLKRNFDNDYKYPQYNPHVTLAYVKKGTCNELVGDKTFEGIKVLFETFVYSNGDRSQNHGVPMKEYANLGLGGGYGGQAGGQVAARGWAGTPSGPQTSNRLASYANTGTTSYMQGNTVVRNSQPDTITPQDLVHPKFSPDEIRAGLMAEMKKQHYRDKEKAKKIVFANLEKNPKYYSDLDQYFKSDQ